MNLALVDNDIALEGNGLKTISGADEICQKIKNYLLTLKYECFDDLNRGIPYFEILKNKMQREKLDAHIRSSVLSVQGVFSILDLNMEYKNFALLVEIKIKTLRGETRSVSYVLE